MDQMTCDIADLLGARRRGRHGPRSTVLQCPDRSSLEYVPTSIRAMGMRD